MDAQTELNLLEAAYTQLLTRNAQQVTANGRSWTALDLNKLITRMDQLRAAVYRQSNGMMQAARNRSAD